MSAAKAPPAIAFKAYDEVVTFSKDNVDAVVKAGAILARGLEGIGNSVVDLAEEVIGESVRASRRLAGARSLAEMFDLQSTLALANFGLIVEEGSRLSEFSVAVIENAFAPINRRMGAAVDRLAGRAA